MEEKKSLSGDEVEVANDELALALELSFDDPDMNEWRLDMEDSASDGDFDGSDTDNEHEFSDLEEESGNISKKREVKKTSSKHDTNVPTTKEDESEVVSGDVKEEPSSWQPVPLVADQLKYETHFLSSCSTPLSTQGKPGLAPPLSEFFSPFPPPCTAMCARKHSALLIC